MGQLRLSRHRWPLQRRRRRRRPPRRSSPRVAAESTLQMSRGMRRACASASGGSPRLLCSSGSSNVSHKGQGGHLKTLLTKESDLLLLEVQLVHVISSCWNQQLLDTCQCILLTLYSQMQATETISKFSHSSEIGK